MPIFFREYASRVLPSWIWIALFYLQIALKQLIASRFWLSQSWIGRRIPHLEICIHYHCKEYLSIACIWEPHEIHIKDGIVEEVLHHNTIKLRVITFVNVSNPNMAYLKQSKSIFFASCMYLSMPRITLYCLV